MACILFMRVISLTMGKMVLDLSWATAYPEIDGNCNVKFKLVFHITPQIPQH